MIRALKLFWLIFKYSVIFVILLIEMFDEWGDASEIVERRQKFYRGDIEEAILHGESW
ncbi:hypothetical protein Theam_1807 (plasmid) [Thermovibrio ammonificans HB-1]|uniref:Uncharacterized protein n=1 Tax=Thermovibrio ammonificans (strain DSM 15698 / JCM 12110 / HB-1) TaxID=648996 RepID=E8T6U0_THEA1|nr:hypothetical protein [Thermovibrio ammonificans]ADU97763.1 hypothetical protein Theam_1807 [Thermovibrio ammonificans HB-1]